MESKDLDVEINIPKKKDGLYYVYLYYNVSQVVVKKYYKGINIDPDPAERLSAAQDLQMALRNKLKSGWVPKTKETSLPEYKPPIVFICDSLDIAINEMRKRLERKTVQCYECTVRFFQEMLVIFKWDKTYLHEFRIEHVEQLMKSISNARKWSNNEYNKNVTYIKAVFTQLVNDRFIKENPAHGIVSKKKEKRKGYETLTAKEQTRVIKHFKKVHPNFATWLKTLYHTGMRPEELRNVKCSMVNLEDEWIQLNEYITKTDDNRKVLIPKDLKNDLSKFDLSNPEAYLFGKFGIRYTNYEKDFQPSMNQLGINRANKIWKEEVIDHLKIDKKMYSHKHQKACHTILDGGSLEAVQRAFGHSRKITTEIYAKILETIQLEEFKEKARDFK